MKINSALLARPEWDCFMCCFSPLDGAGHHYSSRYGSPLASPFLAAASHTAALTLLPSLTSIPFALHPTGHCKHYSFLGYSCRSQVHLLSLHKALNPAQSTCFQDCSLSILFNTSLSYPLFKQDMFLPIDLM